MLLNPVFLIIDSIFNLKRSTQIENSISIMRKTGFECIFQDYLFRKFITYHIFYKFDVKQDQYTV